MPTTSDQHRLQSPGQRAWQSPVQTPPDGLSPSRRRLLRAAASAAPLIATLPSGAAVASASVANCLVEVGNVAAGGGPDGAVTASANDGYLRVPGREIVYLNQFPPHDTRTSYRFTIDGNVIEVDIDGKWHDPEEKPEGTLYIETSSTEVLLLVLYRGDNSNPLTQIREECALAADGSNWPQGVPKPKSPEYCIWPLAKVELQPGNLGMPISCWCSLNPGDTICP